MWDGSETITVVFLSHLVVIVPLPSPRVTRVTRDSEG